MCDYGKDLIHQLNNIEYRKASSEAIPEQFKVPREAAHPLFIQVDFGLVRDKSGKLQPKLVELQGFPSLYAYQAMLSQTYGEVFGLDPNQVSAGRTGLGELQEAAAAGHRGRSRSEACDPHGNRSAASENPAGFSADGEIAWRKDGRYHRRQEGGQVPVLRRRGQTHPDSSHLQPRHRGRDGAQGSENFFPTQR